jgi:hypothetical protein
VQPLTPLADPPFVYVTTVVLVVNLSAEERTTLLDVHSAVLTVSR